MNKNTYFGKKKLYALLKHAYPECTFSIKDFKYIKQNGDEMLKGTHQSEYRIFSIKNQETYIYHTLIDENNDWEGEIIKKYGIYTSEMYKNHGWETYPEFMKKE